MTTKTLLVPIALAVSFAAGWLAKPTHLPAPKKHTVKAGERNSSSSQDSSRQSRLTTSSDERLSHAESHRKEPSGSSTSRQDFEDIFGPQLQENGEQRIQELVERLNLNEEQTRALEEALASSIENFSNPENALDVMAEPPFESTLDKILSEDQHTEFQKLEREKITSQARKLALQKIADLSSLNLSPEKEDEVYRHLYETSETAMNNQSPRDKMTNFMFEMMGLERDQQGFDTANIFEADSDEDIETSIRTQITKEIDQQIETLAPVLNESQLEQYRKELTRKNSLFLNALEGIDED